MKRLLLLISILYVERLYAQDVNSLFNSFYKKFAADKSMQHAISSIYVINSSTGKVVANENIQTGLAPASCQKVIIASSAYELLGHKYIYKTSLYYTGKIVNGVLDGDIIIKGSGDPTLGSWRYDTTAEDSVISEFTKAISRKGINEIKGHVYADDNLWKGEATPDGWIWQDIGNYYGAGARSINWRENQYDLLLRAGKQPGDPVESSGTRPAFIEGLHLKVVATSGEKESGDNAYIYLPLDQASAYVRGTIPVDKNPFTISGAMPHPAKQLAITLEAAIKKIPAQKVALTFPDITGKYDTIHLLYVHNSPPLDSINYWFLKRSINLYGEALLKTMAYEFAKAGSTDSGVSIIKKFWWKKGIDPGSMNIIDGSGLSPANRVTTAALVNVMQFSKNQSWFPSFYNALPEINGLKMKSGSIGGVVSYTGFINSKTGASYTFAFVVNNFDGNANDIRKKMWKLLDLLK
ncbi:MAG: D-alanyl-D-alanine carboxypeptidase/D-alanyl-D-alanine-endopeptidase [Ginsengibacter sp.]